MRRSRRVVRTAALDLRFPRSETSRVEPFKFIVGPHNKWQYDPKQVFFSDDFGNINNYAIIPGTGVAEGEATTVSGTTAADHRTRAQLAEATNTDATTAAASPTAQRRATTATSAGHGSVQPPPPPAATGRTASAPSRDATANPTTSALRSMKMSPSSPELRGLVGPPSIARAFSVSDLQSKYELELTGRPEVDRRRKAGFMPRHLSMNALSALQQANRSSPRRSPPARSPLADDASTGGASGAFYIGGEESAGMGVFGLSQFEAASDAVGPPQYVSDEKDVVAAVVGAAEAARHGDATADGGASTGAGGAGVGAGAGAGASAAEVAADSDSDATPSHQRTTTWVSLSQASIRREGKLVVVLVGLPARGKTFTAFKLRRHLTWLGYNTEIFNVGNFRRKVLGAHHRHDFFNPKNEEGMKYRQQLAGMALDALLESLAGDLDVGIFDATNTTVAVRFVAARRSARF